MSWKQKKHLKHLLTDKIPLKKEKIYSNTLTLPTLPFADESISLVYSSPEDLEAQRPLLPQDTGGQLIVRTKQKMKPSPLVTYEKKTDGEQSGNLAVVIENKHLKTPITTYFPKVFEDSHITDVYIHEGPTPTTSRPTTPILITGDFSYLVDDNDCNINRLDFDQLGIREKTHLKAEAIEMIKRARSESQGTISKAGM